MYWETGMTNDCIFLIFWTLFDKTEKDCTATQKYDNVEYVELNDKSLGECLTRILECKRNNCDS